LFYFVCVSALGAIICLFRPFHPDNTRLFGRIYSWGGIRILGIKIEKYGFKQSKHPNPSVYVVNHQSNLDLFVCGGVIPKRTVTLGKKSLRYVPFFGQLYWLAGNVFIDRKSRTQSKSAMSSTTMALTERNTSIWVFAEGTRNQGKNMLAFKRGAFKMAIEAGVPIVPICLSSYAGDLKPSHLRSALVKIKMLSPMETDSLTRKDMDWLMQKCWDRMKETIDRLDQD